MLTPGVDHLMCSVLLPMLADGFRCLRRDGLLAGRSRKSSVAMVRSLLGQPSALPGPTASTDKGIEHDMTCPVRAHCSAAK